MHAPPSGPNGRHLDGVGLGADTATGCPVVGIGASAGGLAALTALLSRLPADTGLAFVVIQHLDPHHDSLLVELLAKATSMAVVQIADGMVLQANTVHVIPPGVTLTLAGTALRLLPRDVARPPMPIDAFLRSLADERRSHAVAVILSGAGSDGALGVQAVREHGGFTLAQAPDDASFDGMPLSAIATGCTDVVLPAADLGEVIARVAREPSSVRPGLPVVASSLSDDEAALQSVMGLLLAATGVDFRKYRQTTIDRRMRRRLTLRGEGGFREYLEHLRVNPSELQGLAQDLLISVTQFFRDPEAFTFLEQVVFPDLIRRVPPDRAVRIWVPGCSTGEEAYSLAISFAETAGRMQSPAVCQILATDINETVLQLARRATYLENIAADVSPERLQEFFTKGTGGYRLSPAIRNVCAFSRHDVLSDPPMSRMDLVSCRNLLIYLDAVQRQALAGLRFALEPRGYLLLGRSETVSSAPEYFEAVDHDVPVFRAVEAIAGRSTARADLLKLRRRGPFAVTPAAVPDASAYEELVAANEELQSLNEELESSKEEIQSINEELRTVNAELHSRNDALQLAHGFAQATLDTVRSALVVLAPGDVVVNANRSFYRMFQLSPSEVVGRSLADVAPEGLGAARVTALLHEVRNVSQVREDVEITLNAQGRPGRVLMVNARRFVPGDQVLLSAEDVTTLRQVEAERRQSQKMEAIGHLAAGVAHDFNNLLSVVIGGSHLVADELPLDSPVRPILDDILAAGNRAAELTRQLLAYAGKARVVLERLALSDVVVQTAHLLHASIPPHVHLRLDLERDLPPLLADPSQMHQIIANLITNAVEAMTGGGTILVRTGRQSVGRDDVASTYSGETLAPGEYVFVEVQDTGIGMDASTRRQMFDPFFTTKFTGRGLGLAAVHGVVLQHHGTIEVQSQEGRGTAIRVLLATDPAQAPPATPPMVVAPARGTATVVVVDDEPLVLNLARAALAASGYAVITASSGPAALDALREHPEITVAILDEKMPGMNGKETFTAIRALRADLPVIVCSGYGDDAIERVFAGLGVHGFLHKPFSVRQLVTEVARVLGGTAS